MKKFLTILAIALVFGLTTNTAEAGCWSERRVKLRKCQPVRNILRTIFNQKIVFVRSDCGVFGCGSKVVVQNRCRSTCVSVVPQARPIAGSPVIRTPLPVAPSQEPK